MQSSPALEGRPAVRARLLRCIAAINTTAVLPAARDVDVSAAAAGVNVKDAEELEVSHIVSKGTSVLFGPLVRYLQPYVAQIVGIFRILAVPL